MFCPKCGNEVKEGQAFCPSCGSSLSPNSNVAENDTTNDASDVNPGFVPNQPYNMAPPENQKKGFNKKLLIPIIGGVVVIIAIIAIVLFCSKRGPEAKIAAFFDSIKNKDVEEYIDLVYTDKSQKYIIDEINHGKEDRIKKVYKKNIDDVKEDFDDYDFDLNSPYSLEKVGSLKEKEIKKINKESKESCSKKYLKKYWNELTDGAVYKVKQKGAKTFYIEVIQYDGTWFVNDFIKDEFHSEPYYDKE